MRVEYVLWSIHWDCLVGSLFGADFDCNFCISDESFYKGRVCAYPASPEHWVCQRKLKIQGGHTAQMWPLGSSYGPVAGQEVRNPFKFPFTFFGLCINIASEVLNIGFSIHLWSK